MDLPVGPISTRLPPRVSTGSGSRLDRSIHVPWWRLQETLVSAYPPPSSQTHYKNPNFICRFLIKFRSKISSNSFTQSLSLSLNPQPQIQGRNQIINLCKSSISLRVSFFGIFSYLIYVDLISFWVWSGWILVELGGWWIFVFFGTWIWYLLFGFLNILMIGISSVLNLGLGFGCNFGFICGFRFRCWFLSGKDWIFVIF